MRKKRAGFILLIVLLSIVILASGVLAVLTLLGVIAPSTGSESVNLFFETERVRSETVLVLLLMAAMLPVVIVWMALALIPSKKASKRDTLELVEDAEEKASAGEEKSAVKETRGAVIPDVPSDESGTADGMAKKNGGRKVKAMRFGALNEIDCRMKDYRPAPYRETLSLSEICDQFRMYAAYKRNLYYDISDIRCFIASLGVSPIIIMQGMSGTGKTSLATAFGDFVAHDSTIIPIQPMWKERSDMIGYFNEFTERFNETPLLCTLYEANYSRDLFITVLDEMNIARVEYYFADFLSLLELPNQKDRKLEIVSDQWDDDPVLLRNGKLTLPRNMWYIGTANNDDSTFAISDKVYDRAMIMNLNSKAKPFSAPKTDRVHLSYDYWSGLVEEAVKEHPMSDEQRANLRRMDAYLIEHFHISFGNRIMKQIERYVPIYKACGGTELEAMDDMISKKLLRKLEMQNPVYIRNAVGGLLSYLDDLFGMDAMIQCREYLKKLSNNA